MPILFEEITFTRPRKAKKYSPQEPEEVPWYKTSYGEYPYSTDVLDILRAVPAGILGGGVGAVLVEEPEKAALVGAVVGGSSDALLRAQLATEYAAYDLAAPDKPVFHKTKGFKEHQIFVGLLETIVGIGVGGLTGYLGAKLRGK